MTKLTMVATLGLMVTLVTVAPLAQAQKKHKNKYQYIEVTRFDIQGGVDFPADYTITMTEDLVTQLEKTQKFKQVLRQGETAEANAASIR
jgi:TolB-like protein